MSDFLNVEFAFRFNAIAADKQVQGFKYEVVDEEDPTKVRRVTEKHVIAVPSLEYFGINAAYKAEEKVYEEKQANLLFDTIKQTVKDFIKPFIEEGKAIPEGNIWEIIANTEPKSRGKKAAGAAITREMKALFVELFGERRRALGKPEHGIVQQTEFFKKLCKDANTRSADWLKVVQANVADFVAHIESDDLEQIAPMVETIDAAIADALATAAMPLEEAL